MTGTLFDEGTIIAIYGNPGSGKTDFALSLLGFAPEKHKGVNVNCNLPNCEMLHNDIQLFDMFLKYGSEIIFLLDEASLIANAKDSMSKEVRNTDVLMAMIRKIRACIIWVIQRSGLLPTTVRELASVMIYKPSKDKAECLIGDDLIDFVEIPGSKYMGITYETYSFAGFDFLLNLKELFKELSRYDTYQESIDRLEEIASCGYKGYLLEEKKKRPKRRIETTEIINGAYTTVIDERTKNKVATKKVVNVKPVTVKPADVIVKRPK